MNIISMTLGALATSSYIIASKSGKAAVVDPADNAEYILGVLKRENLTLSEILLTHGHFDHTGAAADLKEMTGAKVYIHIFDECMLDDKVKNVAYLLPGYNYKPFTADVLLNDGDSFSIDELEFKVMSTPGHTAGSILYFVKDKDSGEEVIFAGDTIFEGSAGRTDFYSGSPTQQIESLKKLAALEKDYVIYPGHGESTTLKQEKRYNMYLSSVLAMDMLNDF